jgi:MFS transporter, SHS family, sialic acid transporter
MECWPERHRPKLAGAIGAAANVGFLFIAIVALARQVTENDWRWMMVVGASPAVLALCIMFLVPESERWKVAAGKGRHNPILEIVSRQLFSKTLLAMTFSGIPLIGTWAAVSAYIPAWVDQMQEAQIGRSMLLAEDVMTFERETTPKSKHQVLFDSLTPAQWNEVRVRTSRAKAIVQVVMAIGAIIGCHLASFIGGSLGRRPAYFGLCLLSLLSTGYLFRFLTVFDAWFLLVAIVVRSC